MGYTQAPLEPISSSYAYSENSGITENSKTWIYLALPVLGATLFFLVRFFKRSTQITSSDPKNKRLISIQEKLYGDGTRDSVDEASWESFPASDPPAW